MRTPWKGGFHERFAVRRLLRSTALALVTGFFLPAPSPVTGIVFNRAAYADPVTGQIPEWIQSTCCGPSDAHKLTMAAIHRSDDGESWTVDGYKHEVPDSKVFPSQDGSVWLFYYDDGHPDDQGYPYCLFLPEAF